MENLQVIYSSGLSIRPAQGTVVYYTSYDSGQLRYYFVGTYLQVWYWPSRYGSPRWQIFFDHVSTASWDIYGDMPITCYINTVNGPMTFILDWYKPAETGVLNPSAFGDDGANCSPFAAAAYSKYWIAKSYEKKETRRYVEYMGTQTDGGFYARYRVAQYWTYELQQCGNALKSVLATLHPAREMDGSEEAGTIDTVRAAQNGAGGWTVTWTRSTFGAWGPISGTQKTFGGLVYGRCPNNGLGE